MKKKALGRPCALGPWAGDVHHTEHHGWLLGWAAWCGCGLVYGVEEGHPGHALHRPIYACCSSATASLVPSSCANSPSVPAAAPARLAMRRLGQGDAATQRHHVVRNTARLCGVPSWQQPAQRVLYCERFARVGAREKLCGRAGPRRDLHELFLGEGEGIEVLLPSPLSLACEPDPPTAQGPGDAVAAHVVAVARVHGVAYAAGTMAEHRLADVLHRGDVLSLLDVADVALVTARRTAYRRSPL